MEGNIVMLNKAIDEKLAPMQVSQTRLDARTHRPNAELCRDRVQYKLIGEVCIVLFTYSFIFGILDHHHYCIYALTIF